MKTTLVAISCLAVILAVLMGRAEAPRSTSMSELVAAKRATEPPDRPTGFMGSPVAWIEAGERSAWMTQGSTCWSSGTGGGCADTAGFSCTGVAPTREFDVRPGEPVWIHVVGAELDLEAMRYEPVDVAASSVEVEPVASGSGEWLLRSPNADAVLVVGARGKAGGDTSYGMCLRVRGDAPPDAEPVDVSSTSRLIRSRSLAELKWHIDGTLPEFETVAGSVRCARVSRPALSKQRLWRCSSLYRRPAATASRAVRSVGIVAQFRGQTYERSNRTVRMMDANEARTTGYRGIAAVRGYVMERAGGGFSLCTAGWISMPPSCNRGGIVLRGLDADAYHLASYGNRRYSPEEVAISGRLGARVLVTDP